MHHVILWIIKPFLYALWIKKSLLLFLLCPRSAVDERAGRFPGCGCWDQLHESAEVWSVPPDKNFHAVLQPCVGQCAREPKNILDIHLLAYIKCKGNKHNKTLKYDEYVSHFQVDEGLHIRERQAQEKAHEKDVRLLHCQVKNCLVAFDFLKKENTAILVNKAKPKRVQSRRGMNEISSLRCTQNETAAYGTIAKSIVCLS